MRFPKAPSLKQYILRQQVLHLYRDIIRTSRLIPNNKDRADTLRWVRTEFENAHRETNIDKIRQRLLEGQRELRDMKGSLERSLSDEHWKRE
ncbi:2856_t:CDS:2 [Paraglomus occultum]|uniref:LYR motif-containing protein 2 n=1 Tax=Paraglomus occultum TaxID=144539 RepID=A0A9N9AA70_9GLOM|nr:2856_t:CDS:2 [Paraglomus occultum]